MRIGHLLRNLFLAGVFAFVAGALTVATTAAWDGAAPMVTEQTLYTFCSQGGTKCTDGLSPIAGLVQASNGTFYGTTNAGGSGLGTVFNLSVGLGPFVETQPTSGRVGKTIEILGQGFTGTTSVLFNGTAATFHVLSDTYLTATVPVGAPIRDITLSPDGAVAYVLAHHPHGAAAMIRIDLVRRAIGAVVEVSESATQVVMSPDGAEIYVVDRDGIVAIHMHIGAQHEKGLHQVVGE